MIKLSDCKSPRELDDPKKLIPFGWAPGGYMAVCSDCGEGHLDTDKRSWRCQDCADAMMEARK